MSRTNEAECGGDSNANPMGSLFLRSTPSRVRISNLILLAVWQAWNEEFPDAAGRQHPHGMNAAVPAVEVADDADALPVWRPHRKVHTCGRSDRDSMRAQLFERSMMCAFAQQMQVEIGQDPPVAVWIVEIDRVIARICHAQAIIRCVEIDGGLVQPFWTARLHGHVARSQSEGYGSSGRLKDPDDRATGGFGRMRAEDGEGIAVAPRRQSSQRRFDVACMTD